jgi:hypothetical protein
MAVSITTYTRLASSARISSSTQKHIDFDDFGRYMSELADVEMNGQQIRNAIMTARRLDTFKNQRMSYSHLRHVVGVSNKFDKYLEGVKEEFMDDQLRREE